MSTSAGFSAVGAVRSFTGGVAWWRLRGGCHTGVDDRVGGRSDAARVGAAARRLAEQHCCTRPTTSRADSRDDQHQREQSGAPGRCGLRPAATRCLGGWYPYDIEI